MASEKNVYMVKVSYQRYFWIGPLYYKAVCERCGWHSKRYSKWTGVVEAVEDHLLVIGHQKCAGQ